MQFGIGLLGRDWKVEEVEARMLVSTELPRPGWDVRAEAYAAKLAAETILAEPPTAADVSNRAIVLRMVHCARPVRITEAPAVREAFERIYGQQTFELGAA